MAAVFWVPWILFTSLYFVDVIPNSVFAKRVLYSQTRLFPANSPELLEGILEIGYMVPWYVGAVIALGGLFYLLARRDRFSSIAVWFGGNIVFLLIGTTHVHPWCLTPFHAQALLAGAAALAHVCTRRPAWLKSGREAKVARATFGGILVLACIWGVLAGRTHSV